MTLLPYTEEAEWLRFVPCWLHANLKMAARQWNKRQHNRKYLANSATQEISCEFGYLSATCRSARARFLSPIDGANHNARIVPRLRCRIPDATVDQSPASGGVGNRADDFHPQRATSVGEISRPSAFALWMPISFIFENGALKRCASDRTSSSAQAASCGVCFRFRPQDHDTIECGQLSCKSMAIGDNKRDALAGNHFIAHPSVRYLVMCSKCLSTLKLTPKVFGIAAHAFAPSEKWVSSCNIPPPEAESALKATPIHFAIGLHAGFLFSDHRARTSARQSCHQGEAREQ